MSLRPLLRVAACLVAVLALWLTPRLASAQTVAVTNKASLVRLDSNGNAVGKRTNFNPEGINLQDCRDNQRIRFPVVLSGQTAGDVVEVWASETGDCSDPVARSGGTATCWKIPADVAVIANPIVDIPVKEIIKGKDGTGLDADGCRRLQAKTAITVQFILFRGGTGTKGIKDDVPLNAKTLGPPPLSGVRVKPGNGRITVEWDAVGEGGAADVIGAKAYCEINPRPTAGTAATSSVTCDSAAPDDTGAEAADADQVDACTTTTTGGTAAGSIPTPTSGFSSDGVACAAATFSASADGGRIVPGSDFAKYECGSTDNPNGTGIRAGSVGGVDFANGQIIAVAIAGRDSFDNVGELSDPICQYPEETTDFWQNYKNAGGASGGGFCSASGPGLPLASASVLGMFAFAFIAALRKRRRNSSR